MDRIFRNLLVQSELPGEIIVGIDRGSEDEQKEVMEIYKRLCDKASVQVPFRTIVINKPKQKRKGDFFAGFVRNSIEKLVAPESAIVFLDGDCVPQQDFIKEHKMRLPFHLPVITFGKRVETERRNADPRLDNPEFFNEGFFKGYGKILTNPKFISEGLVSWSCNLGMSPAARRLIKRFNALYYGSTGLFNPIFDGAWGGEDTFLGFTSWHLGVMFHSLGGTQSAVFHIPHKSRTIPHKSFYLAACEEFRKKIQRNPLDYAIFQ